MKNGITNKAGEYDSKDFVGVYREVIDGAMPFETLLEHETYVRRCRQICAYYAPKQHEEDVFQELCIRVFLYVRTLKRVDSEDQFFAWASRVTRNISIDMFRASQRQGEIDDTPVEDHIICDTATPDPYLECAIQKWLTSLSPLRQRIVQMYIENSGISTRAIAGLLAKEGLKRSHTAIAKELQEMQKSISEIVQKVGSGKRVHTKSA